MTVSAGLVFLFSQHAPALTWGKNNVSNCEKMKCRLEPPADTLKSGHLPMFYPNTVFFR